MPVKGPSLASLARNLASIGTPDAQAYLGKDVGEAAVEQLQRQFQDGRDPYGDRWAPLAHGTATPLEGSGRLASSFYLLSHARGIGIATHVDFMPAHQEGVTISSRRAGGQNLFLDKKGRFLKLGKLTKRGLRTKFVEARVSPDHTVGEIVIPKRQMVPEVSTGGLGPYWGAAFNDAGREFIKRWMKRR